MYLESIILSLEEIHIITIYIWYSIVFITIFLEIVFTMTNIIVLIKHSVYDLGVWWKFWNIFFAHEEKENWILLNVSKRWWYEHAKNRYTAKQRSRKKFIKLLSFPSQQTLKNKKKKKGFLFNGYTYHIHKLCNFFCIHIFVIIIYVLLLLLLIVWHIQGFTSPSHLLSFTNKIICIIFCILSFAACTTRSILKLI